MRALLVLCLFCIPAFAATERDKAWNALMAAAKERGAQETRLDKSASFVFQREDGSFVTFTQLLATDKGRSICLIAKDEMATACVDWDTGRLKLGLRADAATPWKFYAFDSLDAFEAAKPGFVDQLGSAVNRLFIQMSKAGAGIGGQCWALSRTGIWYRVNSTNC